MSILLKVRGISISKHELEKFTLIMLYILGFDQGDLKVYTYIKYEVHLINSLKINKLIDNNKLCIMDFLINLSNSSAHI